MRLHPALLAAFTLLAAHTPAPAQSIEFIRAARAQELQPQTALPTWADWDKLSAAFAFNVKHRGRIGFIWGTTCLYETLGTIDAVPLFAATGAIENDAQRGMRTAREFGAMMATQESLEAFRSANFAKARALGAMHLSMAQADFAKKAAQQSGMNQPSRRLFNQQSYAMVLHTFSYRPIEILIRQGHVNPETEKASIEAWLHLWSVLAHAMGLNAEQLGPWNWESAQRRDKMLRAEQLVPSDGRLAQPILRAELTRSKERLLKRNAALSETQAREAAVDGLLTQVRLSEGLDAALGLEASSARSQMLAWEF